MIQIQGQKIKLRDWRLEDLPIYESWQIGHQEWKRFDGPYYQKESEGEIRKFILTLHEKIKLQSFPSPRTRLVIADLETDDLVGTVNSYWISKETNWLAAGITIFNPKCWGGGIGKEALTLWIEYLFENRPELVRLDLQTWAGNERMLKLAETLGFKLEGQFRKARIVDGKHYDSIQYGILREEWNSQ